MKKLLFLIITLQITLFAKVFIPIESGDTVEDHINYLEKKYYTITLDKTQTVTIKLIDLEADVDLYTALNYTPQIRVNDCYSSNSNTEDEECILSAEASRKENEIRIMVYGFRESNYKLQVTTDHKTNIQELLVDVPLDSNIRKGATKQYNFSGKKGETYTTTLSNLSGDADIRVSVGRRANFHTFTCKSINGGTNTDKCSVTLNEDTLVYVQVDGYRAANYRVLISRKNIQQAPITLSELKKMIEDNENVSNVNTSQITDMSGLFKMKPNFNDDISNWDVSNVTNMSYMFEASSSFNAPIGNWDVSNVTNMEGMFQDAHYFNQPLENWNVSKVTNMHSMFDSAKKFNQFIGNWDVSNVTDMSYMFDSAYTFNQNIENWEVSNVSNMARMFRVAKNFNQPIGKWDVSNITNMSSMFGTATSFNENIENWNTSNVTNMNHMFYKAKNFNQAIDEWDVSNVTDMVNMFYRATGFKNHDLSKWNVIKTNRYSNFFKETGENNIEPKWILENQKDDDKK